MTSATPQIAPYGGTLDFNGNGIAGCVRCGWRGIANAGPEDPRCPACEIARETDAVYASTVAKVGRNAPCLCGSGKKHKRCCGR